MGSQALPALCFWLPPQAPKSTASAPDSAQQGWKQRVKWVLGHSAAIPGPLWVPLPVHPKFMTVLSLLGPAPIMDRAEWQKACSHQ